MNYEEHNSPRENAEEPSGTDVSTTRSEEPGVRSSARERPRIISVLIRLLIMLFSVLLGTLGILIAYNYMIVNELSIFMVLSNLYELLYNIEINKQLHLMYITTNVLIFLYVILILLAVIYNVELKSRLSEYYNIYYGKRDSIPDIVSTWVLPIISLLVVVVSLIATLGEGSDDNFYKVAFPISTSFVLLMIGIELSYYAYAQKDGDAQHRNSKHGWLTLIMWLLILDFVSYFLLIVGFKSPDILIQAQRAAELAREAVEMAQGTGELAEQSEGQGTGNLNARGWAALALALASLVATFYTVTSARITDEVLANAREGKKV